MAEEMELCSSLQPIILGGGWGDIETKSGEGGVVGSDSAEAESEAAIHFRGGS